MYLFSFLFFLSVLGFWLASVFLSFLYTKVSADVSTGARDSSSPVCHSLRASFFLPFLCSPPTLFQRPFFFLVLFFPHRAVCLALEPACWRLLFSLSLSLSLSLWCICFFLLMGNVNGYRWDWGRRGRVYGYGIRCYLFFFLSYSTYFYLFILILILILV